MEFPKTEKVDAVHDAKCYAIKRLVATVYLDFATDIIGNFRIITFQEKIMNSSHNFIHLLTKKKKIKILLLLQYPRIFFIVLDLGRGKD